MGEEPDRTRQRAASGPPNKPCSSGEDRFCAKCSSIWLRLQVPRAKCWSSATPVNWGPRPSQASSPFNCTIHNSSAPSLSMLRKSLYCQEFLIRQIFLDKDGKEASSLVATEWWKAAGWSAGPGSFQDSVQESGQQVVTALSGAYARRAGSEGCSFPL